MRGFMQIGTKVVPYRTGRAGGLRTGTKVIHGPHASPLIATNIRDFQRRLYVSLNGNSEWVNDREEVRVVRVGFGFL